MIKMCFLQMKYRGGYFRVSSNKICTAAEAYSLEEALAAFCRNSLFNELSLQQAAGYHLGS